MRTTLVIPDTIFTRAKALAKQRGVQLSQFVSEALELRLLAEDDRKHTQKKKFKVNSFSMGEPMVDINNRDDLYTAMEA